MPKIRSLKAEFFRDEDMSTSLIVKVLAAGLICCMADDEGRFRASPAAIKALVFTFDRVSLGQIGEGLAILDRVGFIHLYEFEGKPLAQITNWNRNQYIPPLRRIASTLQAHDTRTAPAVQAHYGDTAPALRVSVSRAGVGKERKGKDIDPPVGPPSEDWVQVCQAWESLTGRSLSALEREAVHKALAENHRLPAGEIIVHLSAFMVWWEGQGIDRRPEFKNAMRWLNEKNHEAADEGRRPVRSA